jgi:hypothetical protein
MSLYLVRHAKAGNRSEWQGDDHIRPAQAGGQAEVEAGIIDKNHALGLLIEDGVEHVVHLLLEVAVHLQHLPQADDASGLHPVLDSFTRDFAHLRAAEADDFEVGLKGLQFTQEPGTMGVAADLTCDDEKTAHWENEECRMTNVE